MEGLPSKWHWLNASCVASVGPWPMRDPRFEDGDPSRLAAWLTLSILCRIRVFHELTHSVAGL